MAAEEAGLLKVYGPEESKTVGYTVLEVAGLGGTEAHTGCESLVGRPSNIVSRGGGGWRRGGGW